MRNIRIAAARRSCSTRSTRCRECRGLARRATRSRRRHRSRRASSARARGRRGQVRRRSPSAPRRAHASRRCAGRRSRPRASTSLVARVQYAPYRLRDGARAGTRRGATRWPIASPRAIAVRVSRLRVARAASRRVSRRAISRALRPHAKARPRTASSGSIRSSSCGRSPAGDATRCRSTASTSAEPATHPGPGHPGRPGLARGAAAPRATGAEASNATTTRMTDISIAPTTPATSQGARTLPGEYYTSAGDPRGGARAHLRAQLELRRPRARAREARATTSSATIAGESLIVAARPGRRRCARSSTCAATAARGSAARSPAASPRRSSARTTPGPTRTDGRLIGAPHMQDVEGFDKRDYPLHAAALAEWEGFLFVNIAREPRAVRRTRGRRCAAGSRASISRASSVGHRVRYDVRANWKLVFQNYSECLHCPTIHPELADGAAVPERRQRPHRGPVPRRLHGDQGAERERDDERARVRPSR